MAALTAPCGLGPQADEPLLHGGRHRRGLPFPGKDLRTRDVFVPCVHPADDLDVRIGLTVRSGALDLRPLSWRLVVGADAILLQGAGLPLHLHGAVALILERDCELVFLDAPQHAHVRRPVVQHCFRVFGVRQRA